MLNFELVEIGALRSYFVLRIAYVVYRMSLEEFFRRRGRGEVLGQDNRIKRDLF